MNLSVQNGTLALANADAVCSEEALEGTSISFRGSRYSVNYALSGLMYLVRSHLRMPHVLGVVYERFIACMSHP